MTNVMRFVRGAKFAAMIVAGLSLAACANNPTDGRRECGPCRQRRSRQRAGLRRQCRRPRVLRVGFLRAHPAVGRDLDKQAQWLRRYNRYAFTVEGHADERGTREYNIALGARRAQAVRDYLTSRGVEANRMRTISYGKERPVAVCNDISCWSQNRRSVTVLNASS